MKFDHLHHQDTPLLIANVWDVPSASIAQKLGFKAVGTSSGAIANMLGYEDGEQMSFAELEYIVKRIVESIDIPLSVDLEAGYSRDSTVVASYIERLYQIGVVGINLEDSLVEGERELVTAEAFAIRLSTLSELLEAKNIELFLNIRTDTFLLSHEKPIEETIHRANLYEAAGADSVFVPCIEQEIDIRKVVEGTRLPVNVMCMPALPDFGTLQKCGVHRISMGNFLHHSLSKKMESTLAQVMTTNSFNPIFSL